MSDSETIDETITTLRYVSESRQLLLARIDQDTLQRSLKRFEKDDQQTRHSKRLRSYTTQTQTFKSKSTLMFKNMEGSLGSNVKAYGASIQPITRKQRYFHYTCMNSVIDISTYCRLSFLRSIPKQTRTAIVKRLSLLTSIQCLDHNLPCQAVLKQVNNKDSLKKAVATVKNYKPASEMEESVQEIYLHILKQHNKKPFMFHKDRIDLYSEADYVVKFWSPVIESFFGSNEKLFIHWGDTTSDACRDNKLAIKLDMRMMLMKHAKYVIDGATGEYAKKPFSSKYFKDRLKLVLASKIYMNKLISSCKHIDDADILNFEIPFLQIMGFEAQLSLLTIQDKELYVVEDLQKFYFPTTKKMIRLGAINDLVRAFSLLKSLLDDLQETIEEGHLDTNTDKLAHIQEESRPPRSKKASVWTSEVACPVESDDGDEEEDEEDEENDDEDDEDDQNDEDEDD